MNKVVINEKLTAIFHAVFSDNTLVLTESMSAADVENWDSLTNMMMISEDESQFGIRFRLKELNQLKTVGDILNILEEKMK